MITLKQIFDDKLRLGTPVISRATDETFIFINDYTEGKCVVKKPNEEAIPFSINKDIIVKFRGYMFLQWLGQRASIFNKRLGRHAKSH